MPQRESRVSQGGEGRIRRVTPEENRQILRRAFRSGKADVASQAGYDFAMREVVAFLRSEDGAKTYRLAHRRTVDTGAFKTVAEIAADAIEMHYMATETGEQA